MSSSHGSGGGTRLDMKTVGKYLWPPFAAALVIIIVILGLQTPPHGSAPNQATNPSTKSSQEVTPAAAPARSTNVTIDNSLVDVHTGPTAAPAAPPDPTAYDPSPPPDGIQEITAPPGSPDSADDKDWSAWVPEHPYAFISPLEGFPSPYVHTQCHDIPTGKLVVDAPCINPSAIRFQSRTSEPYDEQYYFGKAKRPS